jgi:hypothetical protein
VFLSFFCAERLVQKSLGRHVALLRSCSRRREVAMSEYEYWLHGTSIRVEYPDRVEHIRRAGYYTEVRQKAGTSNWFHFAIPTPTIHAGKKMKHSHAHLLAEVHESAKLDKVHIWDGDRCVKKIDDLGLTDQHVARTFEIPKQFVRNGLLVSVYVEFLEDEQPGEVHFMGAGASFDQA